MAAKNKRLSKAEIDYWTKYAQEHNGVVTFTPTGGVSFVPNEPWEPDNAVPDASDRSRRVRTIEFKLRMTEQERENLRMNAAEAKMALSEFIRHSCCYERTDNAV